MKKVFKLFLILISIFTIFPSYVNAEGEELIQNAKSGLLMEISTGEIVFEKNVDERLAVASMTKMMSQILILEAIEEGKITWDQEVKVSSNAAGFGGSQIYLQPNEIMTIRDLMKGISMASANDATVAMAEEIAGSEEEFVKMMNNKAKELGLKNTNFVNSTGLDEENHYSSARDLAIIARHLLLEHEEILEFSSVYEDYLRVDTPNKFWLVNTNKLVRFYEGADGLKTGHTDNAKYCMAVTAKQNDMRLLAVVLGEETAKIRNAETSSLLDYGFNNYKLNIIKSKDEVIDKIQIDKANIKEVEIVTTKDVTKLLKKNETKKEYEYELKIDELKFPINKGDKIGTLIIKDNGQKITSVDVTTTKNIKKLSLFKIWGNFIKGTMTGNMS